MLLFSNSHSYYMKMHMYNVLCSYESNKDSMINCICPVVMKGRQVL